MKMFISLPRNFSSTEKKKKLKSELEPYFVKCLISIMYDFLISSHFLGKCKCVLILPGLKILYRMVESELIYN